MSKTVKFDDHARGDNRLTEIVRGEGYVMVRRPGCMPYVLSAKDFDAMPDWTKEAQDRFHAFEAEMQEMLRRPVAE